MKSPFWPFAAVLSVMLISAAIVEHKRVGTAEVEPQVATLIVVGQPAEHLRVAVPRSTFVACVEGLDPDALDLRQRIVQCAGIEHGRGP